MGFYSRHVFPWLCDRVMRGPRFARLRRELLAATGGEVLEIGFGTGLNLEHYPGEVRRLAAVDPGPGMARIARHRIEGAGIEVDLRERSAESLPFEDGRFDWVVSTWTLCSVGDAGTVVAEIHRVLRPSGRFVFLEHGLSDDPRVGRWQRRLNPIQRCFGDGCRLDLDVPTLMRASPFGAVTIDRSLMEWAPRTHGTMYRGVATR